MPLAPNTDSSMRSHPRESHCLPEQDGVLMWPTAGGDIRHILSQLASPSANFADSELAVGRTGWTSPARGVALIGCKRHCIYCNVNLMLMVDKQAICRDERQTKQEIRTSEETSTLVKCLHFPPKCVLCHATFILIFTSIYYTGDSIYPFSSQFLEQNISRSQVG
jgi:hypothetical protein